MTDDVDSALHPTSLMGVFRRHAGIRAWMERIKETWSELGGSPHAVASVGEHLVMAVDTRAIGHESSAPIKQREFVVYTMREGKITASIAYPTERAEALKAVGLSE